MTTPRFDNQKSEDVFAFAPYRVAEAHYIDFVIATAGAVTEQCIRLRETSEKLSFRETDYRMILGIIKRVKRGESVPLSPDYIRLVLEDKNKKFRLIVDQFGVYRINNDAPCRMDPLSFLCLSRALEGNAERIAKRRGGRRLYNTKPPD